MAPVPPPTTKTSSFYASDALASLKHGSEAYNRLIVSLPKTTVPDFTHKVPKRQETVRPVNGIVAIPATYRNLDGPPAGQVVGIVLGSVFGFILLIWLIYSLSKPKDRVIEDSVVTREPPMRERRKSRHNHRRRSRSPSIDVERRERVIRETREVVTDGPGTVPMPVPMPMYQREPQLVGEFVEERRERGVSRARTATSDGMDEVVVIEEHSRSPPKSRRPSRSRRGSGGYRPVDPDRWGGGDADMRRVRRH